MKKTTYTELFDEAKAAGTNLTVICRKKNINPEVIYHWKNKDPKTITTYKKILAGIEEAKVERQKDLDGE